MILPNSRDAIHKMWLYRLLKEIYDNHNLARVLYFKGGTCAAMQGLLNRFSIDLDFDYVGLANNLGEVRQNLKLIFKNIGLNISDESKKVPQYFLKYSKIKETSRNTIKIDITFPPPKSNKYHPVRFREIDRIIYCQTVETMFANKLVALIERYEKRGKIAGRDIYDIHYFFAQGFGYDQEVIKERRKEKSTLDFFKVLISFINENINQRIIDQDINFLLRPKKFQQIRKVLKEETIMFLNNELERIKK